VVSRGLWWAIKSRDVDALLLSLLLPSRYGKENFGLRHSYAYHQLRLGPLGSALMERILIGFIALVLLLMAVLPLFGFNLRLFLGPAALVTFDRR